MEQVGAVRKRWLVERFQRGERAGALWAINTRLQDFGLSDARGYSAECRELFSRIRTDLNPFSEGEMACLENHGYSLADTALRSRAVFLGPSGAPFEWPHADWSATENAQEALRASDRRRLPRDIARFCLNRFRPRRSRSG
jgi:NTE family protein